MRMSSSRSCITTLRGGSVEDLRARVRRALCSDDADTTGSGIEDADRAGTRFRLFAQATTAHGLASALAGFAIGDPTPEIRVGECATLPDLAFVFAGQSETRVGMGSELFPANRPFRGAMARCSDIVSTRFGTSLVELLYGEADPRLIGDARFAQPALFALQSGLVALWRSWGIEPTAVAGHSLGEYAAASAAGVMSLEHGVSLVARRGNLTQALAGAGEMAVVFADAAVVADYLSNNSLISLAAINAPEVVVVSGPVESIAQCVAELKARGVTAKPLRISHAFHSVCIEPILDPLEEAVAETPMADAKVPFFSALEGRRVSAHELREPRYWRRHAREPVLFFDAVHALHQDRCSLFLEIGPHATLTSLGERCLSTEAEARWLPSLKRSGDDLAVLAQAASDLWLAGAEVNIARVAVDVGWRQLAPSRTGLASAI